MSASTGVMDEGGVLRSRSAFARRCTVTGGVLLVLGVVGIARWWTLSLGLLVLVIAALVAVIAIEELPGEAVDTIAAGPVGASTPGSRTVRFHLPATVGAESVALVGEFNGWSRTATPMRRGTDGFVVDLRLEPGRTYRYRYLLDGHRWENDWAADRYAANPFGSEDSVIDVGDDGDDDDDGDGPLGGRAGADDHG